MWQMVFWNWNVIIDRSGLCNWISNFLALQCSSNWAVKSHMLGSRPMYRVHFYPCKEWDEFEIKLIWNCRIQMKLRCDHRNCNSNLNNCKFFPATNFQGLNGVACGDFVFSLCISFLFRMLMYFATFCMLFSSLDICISYRIAKISVTSPIVINMQTRDLLAAEAKSPFV